MLTMGTSVAGARNMVQEIDHPACGPIKLLGPPVKYSQADPSIRSPPPLLGEHTDQILEDIVGLDREKIRVLKAKGVLTKSQ